MNEQYENGSDTTQMPEVIQLKFQVAEQQVLLNLTKSKYVHSKVPVYVGGDNGIEKMDLSILDVSCSKMPLYNALT